VRSLWKAHYLVEGPKGAPALEIHEESAWVKFLDSVVGEIPLVGLFTGYF
jgi:hypothetical protein